MYYTVKVRVKTEDEKSGRIKTHSETYLVKDAVSPTDVEVQVTEYFKGVGFDWEITKIETSPIVDVIEKPDRADRFNA